MLPTRSLRALVVLAVVAVWGACCVSAQPTPATRAASRELGAGYLWTDVITYTTTNNCTGPAIEERYAVGVCFKGGMYEETDDGSGIARHNCSSDGTPPGPAFVDVYPYGACEVLSSNSSRRHSPPYTPPYWKSTGLGMLVQSATPKDNLSYEGSGYAVYAKINTTLCARDTGGDIHRALVSCNLEPGTPAYLHPASNELCYQDDCSDCTVGHPKTASSAYDWLSCDTYEFGTTECAAITCTFVYHGVPAPPGPPSPPSSSARALHPGLAGVVGTVALAAALVALIGQ